MSKLFFRANSKISFLKNLGISPPVPFSPLGACHFETAAGDLPRALAVALTPPIVVMTYSAGDNLNTVSLLLYFVSGDIM